MQFLSGLSGSQFGQLGLEFGLGFGELGDLALNSFNSCATNDHYYRRMWYALQFDSVMADTATNNNNNITVMDTSNSPPPDSMDSRKRNAESSPDNLKTKRTNYGGDGVCQIKILVPSYAAGAIIGKGGETIAQIQKDTGSKIKMSKANDFYPGTSDRVCLISGQPDDIKHILKFIMEKIRARPDMSGDPDREKQMKVLVPNSTAGMIIGKGGSYVKLLQEQSGAYVQLSQKAKELQERCITVSGHFEANEKAMEMILEKIAEDPSSGSCSNVSYADVNGPVASVNPTGSPFATTPFLQQQQQQGNMSNYGSSLAPHQVGAPLSVNNGVSNNNSSGLNFSLNFNSQPPVSNTTLAATSQLIEHMKVLIQALGYSDLASNEISAAMATLAKYGILGLGLGTQQALNNFTSPPSWQDPLAQSSGSRALDFPASSSFGGRPGSPGGRNYGGGASDVESKKVEIEVPEIIVGAILGPGGRSLNDIMGRSGANVQISKKGSFAPGTRNRVVTISGSPNAIAHAQILIDSKIKDEEWKRNSLNMNTD
ncbi:hypothetical protein M8J77_025207 [Diaphorina citri]|nr:hypothetical protein M8J77_025207 [Diaphorina citri]